MKNYQCKRTKDVFIDGDLNKEVWKTADAVFLTDTSDGSVPVQRTTVKALWNDEFLFVAFSCEDNFINAKMTNFNQPLYDEEVVEVFLDDDSDGKTYVEIEVNPNNAVLHYFMNNDLKGRKWAFARVEPCVVSAVKRNEVGWDVEMAIPLQEFITAPNLPPLSGDVWRVNFYRIDRPADGRDEYTAWSPTGLVDYHRPLSFGKLEFVY